MSKKKIKFTSKIVNRCKRDVHGLDAAIKKYSPIASEYGFTYKEMVNKNFICFVKENVFIDFYFVKSKTVCIRRSDSKDKHISLYDVSDEELVEVFKNQDYKTKFYHVKGKFKETLERERKHSHERLTKEIKALYEKEAHSLQDYEVKKVVDYLVGIKSENPIECIYMIRNIDTEHIYIGSTNDFERRKAIHLFTLKSGLHHNRKLQSDYDNYGLEVFTFEILHVPKKDKDYNRDSLYLLEQIWIDKYAPEYNIQKIVQKFNK